MKIKLDKKYNLVTCAHEHEVGHCGLGVGEAVPGQGEAQVVRDLVRGQGEHQAGVLRVDQVQVRQVGPHIRLEVVQSREGGKNQLNIRVLLE